MLHHRNPDPNGVRADWGRNTARRERRARIIYHLQTAGLILALVAVAVGVLIKDGVWP